jgi:hypothetical protein
MTLPRVLWWFGGGAVSYERGTPVQGLLANKDTRLRVARCVSSNSRYNGIRSLCVLKHEGPQTIRPLCSP